MKFGSYGQAADHINTAPVAVRPHPELSGPCQNVKQLL